jgi:ABC-type glycerol-3-phosphate transport system substrate-binding protein
MKHRLIRVGITFGIAIVSVLWIQSALQPTVARAPGPEAAPATQTSQFTLQAATAITIWHAYYPGSANEQALTLNAGSAQTAFPNLTVVLVYVPLDQIYDLYRQSVVDGGGPDLFIALNERVDYQARAGEILNLDPWLQGQFTATYPTAIDGMRVDGHLYPYIRSIPLSTYPHYHLVFL